MSVTPIVDVADAKAQLNIPDADSSSDAELGDYILTATEIVNAKCGYTAPTVVAETVFTRTDIRRTKFILSHTPVLSLTSIIPTQIGMPTPDMTQVVLDSETGVVYWANWMVFYGTFVVTYTAGRSEIPPALRMAALLIVQDMWETQRGANPLPTPGDPGGGLAAYAGDRGLPARALQLMRIAPYSAAPGIA
jgi:hypothetical protein